MRERPELQPTYQHPPPLSSLSTCQEHTQSLVPASSCVPKGAGVQEGWNGAAIRGKRQHLVGGTYGLLVCLRESAALEQNHVNASDDGPLADGLNLGAKKAAATAAAKRQEILTV